MAKSQNFEEGLYPDLELDCLAVLYNLCLAQAQDMVVWKFIKVTCT